VTSEHYDRGYFEAHLELTKRSAEVVVPLVTALLEPRSVCDVGCGRGIWLSVFEQHGVTEVLGMDGDYVDRELLEIDPDRFRSVDLEEEGVPASGRFDLAVSLEVAEHLPDSAATGFVDGLVALAPAVLFSAAVPGQGGNRHVNEQWPDYWRALFDKHDYEPIDCIRPVIWEQREVRIWYRQNTLLYASRTLIESSERLSEARARYADRPLSVVHPGVLEVALERPWDLLRKLTAEVEAGKLAPEELNERMARMLRRFAERARDRSTLR
jgi:SAM-dependent methyltransferase